VFGLHNESHTAHPRDLREVTPLHPELDIGRDNDFRDLTNPTRRNLQAHPFGNRCANTDVAALKTSALDLVAILQRVPLTNRKGTLKPEVFNDLYWPTADV